MFTKIIHTRNALKNYSLKLFDRGTRQGRVTRRFEKNSINRPQAKKICIKAQFESPHHLHQTTFETYIKLCFETAYIFTLI
jgi:hypothetical protein